MKKILLIIITLISTFFSYSFQLVKEFPTTKGFDDSILTNQMFEFKGFKEQGYLILEYKNFKKANIFINGKKLYLNNIKGEGTVKIDISKYTRNDNNIFQISSLDGEVKVKVPYPEIKVNLIKNERTKFLDEFLNSQIKAGFPSAQLSIVKDGVLIYQNSFGYVNNYKQDGTVLENRIKVNDDTLYDLASNTKMYATNYAIMKLVSDGKLKVEDYVNKYFPEFTGGGKEEIQVSDLLKHQAGFPADPQYFNDVYDKDDGIVNGKNDLFAIGKENVEKAIMKTPLIYKPKTSTKYSDVDYMLLGLLVEKISGQDLDVFLNNEIYSKLCLKHTYFNPLEHGFVKDNVAATELNGNTRDGFVSFNNARTYTIQGEVHDEKAFYSMNGISGHAGLFSNSFEVAKLAQIMINQGGYGEYKFFNRTTLDHFVKPKDINSSYGLGWRRQGDYIYRWAFSGIASKDSIGHTGWTGTLTIIDPSQNLVVVLLTNAKNTSVINPKANPNKFYGDRYYVKNYGAVASLAYDLVSTKTNSKEDKIRLNETLKDLIMGRYKLMQEDANYTTKADFMEVLELINLLEKREGKLSQEFKEIKREMEINK
ncbi:penicillin binding protein PBP4B [Streptobacillus felis]|uniref:Penicillin binding protein PBP4B n=1 Tax=Streptobacillus felis TaxID=1384509 RepID=A0A7Z0T9R7_9FUSO|nr:penicillin binding protein PBP4B [Streptobacillus felis]NYV27290.1 penicillin binding protein PBP4B [Streptobacillus felis]